jgi:lysophospholipase L1-like esterase
MYMRTRFLSFFVLPVLLLSGIAHAAQQTSYYLALGDSLAIGIQPSANGDVPTNQGYADDLYAVLHARAKGLSLAKLGCSGETTTSMIEGGICTYAQGSQLAAALEFLQTHNVSLVTIDIGANDIDHCISVTGINTACVTAALAAVETNLPQILAALRSAAGPNTPIVGMNYYDPFLAAWVLVSNGQTLATESLQAANGFNSLLESIYQAFAIPVADVATAYRISDFAQVPIIKLPLNVFLTLTWTWMAAPAPLGPDIHPNAVGYAAIAAAFADKILVP